MSIVVSALVSKSIPFSICARPGLSPFLFVLDQGDVLLKWSAILTFISQWLTTQIGITQVVLLIRCVDGGQDRT